MKIIIPVLLLFSVDVFALDEFGIEEPLPRQIPIAASIVTDLRSEIDLEASGCKQKSIQEALEATEVALGASAFAVLIKPKAWCLCGAYFCPAWLYQFNNKNTNRIWSTPGTGFIHILDKKSNGYRQLKVGGGTAGHSFEEIWAWDGKKYKVIERQDTDVGQEK